MVPGSQYMYQHVRTNDQGYNHVYLCLNLHVDTTCRIFLNRVRGNKRVPALPKDCIP
jgi:hypothetical protein